MNVPARAAAAALSSAMPSHRRNASSRSFGFSSKASLSASSPSISKANAPDVTEDVGVEEEKGGEPAPPSPPPRALQDHNDNEETKDEAKAKVKKTPAKKGYVSARVKKIEGKE